VLKRKNNWVRLFTSLIPALKRQDESSRPAWAMQKDPVSHRKIERKEGRNKNEDERIVVKSEYL
jgi:hypothetical protein